MSSATSLIYHPSVTHYLKFVSTTVGRDKLLRTIQYFSRFYAWYLLRTNGLQTAVASYGALKTQLGLTRKLLRIGKNVEHFKAAATISDTKGLDPVIKYLAVGRQLGYAGYLSFDALTVPDAVGLRKSTATQRLQREAYRFWAAGLICSVVSGVYSLAGLRAQQKRLDRKDGESAVAGKRIEKYARILSQKSSMYANDYFRERAAINLQLISDLADLTVPATAIGLVSFDDGLVGLAGTLSSLIGVYTQWKKTA